MFKFVVCLKSDGSVVEFRRDGDILSFPVRI